MKKKFLLSTVTELWTTVKLFLGFGFVSPFSIIAIWGAWQVELPEYKGEFVLGVGSGLGDAVRRSDRPIGRHKCCRASAWIWTTGRTKVDRHDPRVFSCLGFKFRCWWESYKALTVDSSPPTIRVVPSRPHVHVGASESVVAVVVVLVVSSGQQGPVGCVGVMSKPNLACRKEI